MSAESRLSFCIVALSRRADWLQALIDSIRAEQADSEILVAGTQFDAADVRSLVPDAGTDEVAYLRNQLLSRARADVKIVLDDDVMLERGFIAALIARSGEFDVLRPTARFEDGGRIAAGWVLSRAASERVRWNEGTIRAEEADQAFERDCQQQGLRIENDSDVWLWHQDRSLTLIAGRPFRRPDGSQVAFGLIVFSENANVRHCNLMLSADNYTQIIVYNIGADF